jgi:2,3-bisphosphoglycerate-dependent phosphoglycerate mutase
LAAHPAEVWLIRHGQSQANAGEATQTPASIQLTELGHQQAKSVAEGVLAPPDWVVVSPFERTLQTAGPTLARFGMAGSSVLTWPIQEFTYLSPLRCRGTTLLDRREWAREYWLRADPAWEDGDGAESFESFMARIHAFHEQLQQQRGFGLVFGHGMFFKAYLIALEHGFEADSPAMTRFRQLESNNPIHNGQVIRLRADGKVPDGR